MRWLDFELDEVFGPLLVVAAMEDVKIRRQGFGTPSVMDDAVPNTIQETGQGQRPARMVGLPDSDSYLGLGQEAQSEGRIAGLRTLEGEE